MSAPRALRASLATLLALAAATTAHADWTQSRADAQNTAFAELDAPKSAAPRAWTFDGTGRVSGYEPGMTVWSSPSLGVVEGRALLFVGGYDHFVWALDAATGEVRWKYATGDAVAAAPVLWRDGAMLTLFAASNDREVYALDPANGARRWSTSLETYRPSLGGAHSSSPCMGRVGQVPALFVGLQVFDRSLGKSLQRGAVSALSAADGKLLWSVHLGDNELTSPICADLDGQGRLFVGSADGNLYGLDATTGATLWKHTEHDGIAGAPAMAAFDDGTRLVLTGSRYGEVRALDARDGTERWRLKTADRITGSPSVARVGGRLLAFVPSYDRHLYALDARTGAVVWKAAARAGFYSSPAVVPLEPPLVLASAWDHALHGVEALTGAERFSFYTGAPLWDVGGLDTSTWSSPAAARLNGVPMAFVGSYDGKLRGLPLDTLVGTTPGQRRAVLFWLSFPATLGPLVLLALWLSRRYRARAGSRPPPVSPS